MKQHTDKTAWAKIYTSGPISVIENICRGYCLEFGLCVTVEKTKFIYTGGEEFGAVIGLVNYPKFPSDQATITSKATVLAKRILKGAYQKSILVVDPDLTNWITIDEYITPQPRR